MPVKLFIVLLTDVLGTLRKAELKLNVQKCKFAYRELDYLGYKVNKYGIRHNVDHIKTIKEYPVPTEFDELEGCLGLFYFFVVLLKNFQG